MKISPEQDYAVITGDIVKSSQLSPSNREWLVSEIQRGSEAVQKTFPNDVPLAVDIFRGDGWQMLVANPGRSLRIGLFFRAWLLSRAPSGSRLDTRMAIAVGSIRFVPGESVSAGDGEAYRASGRALDSLKEPQRLALLWPSSAGEVAKAIEVFAPVLDAVVQGWTSLQARAVLGRLRGATQEEIAQDWPEAITRQAVARHVAKARLVAVEPLLTWLESNPKGLQ